MSDFLAPVEPLKTLKPDGQPYTRRLHVETQLGRILGLPPSERVREVLNMYPECIFHLLRRKEADEELYERLWRELIRRIAGTVRRFSGLKKFVVEEIVMKVEEHIFKLLLSDPPDMAMDFYEIGFAEGVKALTLNAIMAHERSMLGTGHRGWLKTPDELGVDGKVYERPFELVHDTGATPEDTTIKKLIHEQREEAAKMAYAAVKDPLDREVLRLHFEEEIPIWSSDPEEDAVAHRLHLKEGQVRHRYKRGIKDMQEALMNGEQNDAKSLL